MLGSQASDRVWIVGIFGEAVDEKNNNGNFTDFSVLWNGLWFFQLGQLIRDTGRWNYLPLVNCRDPVYDKKCKAKSCFIRPFLQLLVRCNSISSASPTPPPQKKKMQPLEKNPFLLFNTDRLTCWLTDSLTDKMADWLLGVWPINSLVVDWWTDLLCGTKLLRVLIFVIFAIFPAIRKNKFLQIKIIANIFPAKIYSRVNFP